MADRDLEKAARRGEPSYVWREGQERRLEMIRQAAGSRLAGLVLENGCGIGLYAERLATFGGQVAGLEYDFDRAAEASRRDVRVLNAAGEALPFSPSIFDLILSHEVLEHVRDDQAAIYEMIRVLKRGGRLVIFCPNRGYPFETHGIYWRGKYHFGNFPLVNYLPRAWRNRLAPHVRVYTRVDLQRLVRGAPIREVDYRVIFGGYDNLIRQFGPAGRVLRALLQSLEKTPLRALGLSHYWVLEKT